MSTIAELAEDRVVEGIYAVARKRRLRTRGGSAYLALELVDPSGSIEGRVWTDVDLLDARPEAQLVDRERVLELDEDLARLYGVTREQGHLSITRSITLDQWFALVVAQAVLNRNEETLDSIIGHLEGEPAVCTRPD